MNEHDHSRAHDPEADVTKTMVLPTRAESSKAPDAVWHICVEVVGGPMDGHRARVETPWFTIGRDAANDLSLAMDPMVSSRHARIVREGQHFWLEDLGSRNGVYIGDQKLAHRVLLGPGSMFTVGRTQLEFMPR